MYSQYTADVFAVHRRCTLSTPLMYSKYTAVVLKVHRRCMLFVSQKGLFQGYFMLIEVKRDCVHKEFSNFAPKLE